MVQKKHVYLHKHLNVQNIISFIEKKHFHLQKSAQHGNNGIWAIVRVSNVTSNYCCLILFRMKFSDLHKIAN